MEPENQSIWIYKFGVVSLVVIWLMLLVAIGVVLADQAEKNRPPCDLDCQNRTAISGTNYYIETYIAGTSTGIYVETQQLFATITATAVQATETAEAELIVSETQRVVQQQARATATRQALVETATQVQILLEQTLAAQSQTPPATP